MSEVINETNAIILASAEKLVEIGAEIAERMLEGKDSTALYEDGLKIQTLMQAYVMHEELEESEVEALLYCLRKLSGQSEFPTVQPIVGQRIVYVIEEAQDGNGGGIDLAPAPNSVIWSDGVSWQVISLQELWNKLMAL